MKKYWFQAKSQTSVHSSRIGVEHHREDVFSPMDSLFVRIHSLRLSDDDKRNYQIAVFTYI